MIGYQYAMRPVTLGPRLQPMPMMQGGGMPPPQLPALPPQVPPQNDVAPLAQGFGLMGQGMKDKGKGLIDWDSLLGRTPWWDAVGGAMPAAGAARDSFGGAPWWSAVRGAFGG